MIAPYKRPPEPPRLGLLTDAALVVDEQGRLLEPGRVPEGMRVFARHETISELLYQGKGEALCWNGEPVRWRPQRGGPWRNHADDVRVLRLALPEQVGETMRGLVRWRDWLAAYGAAPSSLGQSAWSLLRATLRRPLYTSCGQLPPISWTMGARQELCVPQGEYAGRLEHYDLPAAYASALGELRYGRRWLACDRARLEQAEPHGFPAFARAQVRIPGLRFGPLPKRPRRRVDPWLSAMLPVDYPTGRRLQGVWTWEELRAAERAGCRVRVLEAWLHLPMIDEEGWEQPFLPWWRAVQEGRRMPGLAGMLAKTTGNALWGQFCMSAGARTVMVYERDGRQRRRTHRLVPASPGRPAAHDLTETVSGRVRARLAEFMLQAGEHVLSVHTDGAWTWTARGSEWVAPADWRRKAVARRLRILTPQTLCYQEPGRAEPRYVVAGSPASQAEAMFEGFWDAYEANGRV